MKKTIQLLLLFSFAIAGNSLLAQKREIFKVVEQMPSFPGCEKMKASKEVIKECAQEKMLNFISTNLKYPAKAREKGLEGTAVVQFVVTKMGNLEEINVVRDIEGQFEGAILDMIRIMPNWNPGTQRGRPVAVQITLPVKFKLDKDTKGVKGLDGLEGDAPAQSKDAPRVYKSDRQAKVGIFHKNDPNMEVPPPPPAPEEEVFKVVEQMPRFPGCDNMKDKVEVKDCSSNLMLQHLYKSIRYPVEARKRGVEGTAVVQYIVEKDGRLSNIKLTRDPGAGCGEEAVRVIQSMNDEGIKWVPGMQRGRKVRVLYTMPIKFKLENKRGK